MVSRLQYCEILEIPPILSLYTFVFCKAEIVSAGNQRWKIRKTVILRWKNEGQVTDSG